MSDLHELLESARADAPPPHLTVDDIVAAGHRRRRWVRTQRIGSAGVIAVAAVTGMILMASHLAASRPGSGPGLPFNPPAAQKPAAPPAAAKPAPQPPPFSFTFNAYTVGDYRVLTPEEITTTSQNASILTDFRDAAGKLTSVYAGTLTVYRPGVAPPAVYTSGTKITVQGRPAFQGIVRPSSSAGTSTEGSSRRTIVVATEDSHPAPDVLAWQYADNAWAVIYSQPTGDSHDLTAAAELALAEGFHTGSPVRARAPFQAGYLPAGWQLLSILGQSFVAEDAGIFVATYVAPHTATSDESDNASASMTIAIGQQDAPPPDAPQHKDKCSTSEHFCSWPIEGTRFYLAVTDNSGTLSNDELLKIGQALVFDNFDQPGSWHVVP